MVRPSETDRHPALIGRMFGRVLLKRARPFALHAVSLPYR